MKNSSRAANGLVKMFTVQSFEDGWGIAEQVINGFTVLVDFKHTDQSVKQRLLSFFDGTMFGLDGQLLALRDDLILLLPLGALAGPE
jgi:FtsZ-interacting cell division protein YlmF